MALQSGYSIKTFDESSGYIVFTITNKGKGLFESYVNLKSFWKNMMKLEPKDRCYYETIRGDSLQRPRFDIDMKKSALSKIVTHEVVLKDLIYAIIQYTSILEIKIEIEQIQVYSSHGEDKYSYHVVLTGVHHKNNEEANMFYQGVHYHIPSRSVEFIDKSVYKSLQQFRFYGNCKRGDFRPKIKANAFFNDKALGEEQKDPYQAFLQSLIVPPPKKEGEWIPLTTTIHHKPIANIQVDFSIISSLVPPGFILDVKGDISRGYKLQRTHPSFCYVCNRIHENENAYLRVTKDGVVVLKCFRDLEPRYALGTIPREEEEDEESSEETNEEKVSLTNGDKDEDENNKEGEKDKSKVKEEKRRSPQQIKKTSIGPRRTTVTKPESNSVYKTLASKLEELENRKR